MASNLRMIADGVANTGLLDIPVGGVVETVYEFKVNGKFGLSERPDPATLDRAALTSNINLIVQWTTTIYSCCDGYDTSWAKSKYTIDDTTTNIEFTLKLGNDPAVSATFDKTTALVTFAARGEMTLKAFEMSRFITWLRDIETSMKNHA